MFKNYLKTALRNLWRERGSSIINISGLTLGITSSLVLFLLIKHAVSFDTFHTHYDRIYRATTQSNGNSGLQFSPGIPAIFYTAFKNDFPEAEAVTFTSYRSGSLISIPQPNGEFKKFDEPRGVVFTEPNFFNVFDRKIFLGEAESGLDDPNEALISKSWALKYFGKEDAIGEIVKFDNQEYLIKGIMEDAPIHTDLPFELMLSYITIQSQNERGWNSTWSDEQCYFLLKEGVSINEIESRIPEFVQKYLGEDNPNQRTFLLQPLSELHYDDRFSNYNYNIVPKPVLVALFIIAIFLILTSCINFINLSTAEALKRAKEVGVRKVLGGTRLQLITQFLGETAILTIISVLCSLAFTQIALRFLNPFLEQNLELNLTGDPAVLTFLVFVTIVVSLLSGGYPSFVLSGFKPALAIKNFILHKNSTGYMLRRSLVVFQFFISQFFIIGTIVIVQQMNFLQRKDLGFSKEAIISIPIPESEKPVNDGASKMKTLKNELSLLSGIEMISLNSAPPASGSVSGTHFTLDGLEDDFTTQVKQVDGNYLALFDIKILAGNTLSDGDTATGFVVNKRLVSTLGYANANEIIGKEMRLWGKRLPIIGVVNDFHTMSLSKPLEPVVLFNSIGGFRNLSVKITSSELQGVISQIQKKWEVAYPDFIFTYEFLDEQIRGFYDGQRKISVLLGIFTSMAIFIGCLGLFGLATFMAGQKTKEIGIRKILGASVHSIIMKFSREFLILVGVGFLLAAPISWFIMRNYLDQFAYRIDLGPLTFLMGIGITLIITIVTVGYKSFAAATVNPADSIRYE